MIVSLGKASGAQKENDNSESGESGERFTKSHCSVTWIARITYTMQDVRLRSNQELTFAEVPPGNVVPVPAPRSGTTQEDSDLVFCRHCKCRSIVFGRAKFSHLKFLDSLVAGIQAGDRWGLIVRQVHSNALRRNRQTHARAFQYSFLDGPQPVEALQFLVFRQVTQPSNSVAA